MLRRDNKGKVVEYIPVLFRRNTERIDKPGVPDECTLILDSDTVELSSNVEDNHFFTAFIPKEVVEGKS